MALSLPGERSLAAATPAHPFAAFTRWIAEVKAARNRRMALETLLQLDSDRLKDLGISRVDISEALARKDKTAMLGLNMARARNARP